MTARHLRPLLLTGAMLVSLGPTALAQRPLEPTEVLASVDQSLPLLERARQDLNAAQGVLEEAAGAFDLSWTAGSKVVRGFYDNERASTFFEQPVAPLGGTAFAGYRTGRGLFAPYDTGASTLSTGELTAGFQLPLLRGRAIDERRANREQSLLGTRIAERSLDQARLTAYRRALTAYWEWAGAGQQRAVASALLNLAEARDQQLADGVALGQLAAVERTDNRRAILQRRSALVSAERQLEMRAIELSLYYRSAEGEPLRPPADRLPLLSRPPIPLGPSSEADAVQRALAQRPERQEVLARRDQQEIDLRLAQNRVLPALGLFAQGARDYGAGSLSRVGSMFESGFTFQFPLQNRRGTGKRVQAQAKLSAVQQDIRWIEDRIRADVQDAYSALRAAAAVLDVVAEEVAVARELEALERDRFTLGDSTQFLVNLRELATAEAALREARALADYRIALMLLDVATGDALVRGISN